MRINRGALLEALARVEPGRSTRDFLAQSACYVFTAGSVTTFNDEICCRTASGLDRGFRGAVPGAPLKAALENIADDDIELDVRPNELRVTGKRKRFGVRLESEILLPVEEVEPPAGWQPLEFPEEFAAAVKAVCAIAASDSEGFAASCVNVRPDGLEACDLVQALRYDVPTTVESSFLVRASALSPVAGFGPTKVGVTDSWFHLRNKLLVYSVRRHLDEYLPLDAVLAFRGEPATLPKGAIEAAKLGAVFSGDDKENNKVSVSVTEGRMRVRGEGAFGWAEADLELAYRGTPLAFRIAPLMLEKLVTDHNNCEVGPGKLRVDGERWQYVTVLGRPDDNTKAETTPLEDGPEPASEFAHAEESSEE